MSTPQQLDRSPLPDICRNRHGGNENSELANLSIHSRKEADRARLFKLTEARGDYGVTLHEAVNATGIPIQTVSGRLSEMKRDNVVVPNGEKRNNAAVLIVPKKGQLNLLA